MPTTKIKPGDRILSIHELTGDPKRGIKSKVPYHRVSIYRKVKEGTFPAPIRLGAYRVGWLESEVDEWIAARAAERDAETEDAA